jgi:hypothetical protein
MASEYILLKSDGNSHSEKKFVPTAGKVLGFDSSTDPVMVTIPSTTVSEDLVYFGQLSADTAYTTSTTTLVDTGLTHYIAVAGTYEIEAVVSTYIDNSTDANGIVFQFDYRGVVNSIYYQYIYNPSLASKTSNIANIITPTTDTEIIAQTSTNSGNGYVQFKGIINLEGDNDLALKFHMVTTQGFGKWGAKVLKGSYMKLTKIN